MTSNDLKTTTGSSGTVPVMKYRQIVFWQEFLDQNQVYLDNRTLHTPFRLVLIEDLLREFDNFHLLESNQIQLFKDSLTIHVLVRTANGQLILS